MGLVVGAVPNDVGDGVFGGVAKRAFGGVEVPSFVKSGAGPPGSILNLLEEMAVAERWGLGLGTGEVSVSGGGVRVVWRIGSDPNSRHAGAGDCGRIGVG